MKSKNITEEKDKETKEEETKRGREKRGRDKRGRYKTVRDSKKKINYDSDDEIDKGFIWGGKSRTNMDSYFINQIERLILIYLKIIR